MSRPRTRRRVLQRELKKIIGERERLWSLLPGGSADHPVEVHSAAVIDGRARSQPCPQCEGALLLHEHAACMHDGELLRLTRLTCKACGAPREIWFRLVEKRLN